MDRAGGRRREADDLAQVVDPQRRARRAAKRAEVVFGGQGAGADVQDQARVETPERALANGSDLLVIGRPITGADDVGRAAANLAAALKIQ